MDMAGTTALRISSGTSTLTSRSRNRACSSREVALDVVNLLAQRHVRAAVAKQVARELGEVDQQLSGFLRPGVDLTGHRRQRVVDEMGGDLGPQRAQLGLGQPLFLLIHDRQFDLGCHQAGRLLDDAQFVLAGPSDGAIEGDQRANPATTGHERASTAERSGTGRVG